MGGVKECPFNFHHLRDGVGVKMDVEEFKDESADWKAVATGGDSMQGSVEETGSQENTASFDVLFESFRRSVCVG